MKKIFMILVISLIPISIHAQHVYIADFQNVDSYLGANRQMVSFSIPQTETWTEDFICAGSVYAENIDFIETSFNYYPGRSLRYVRFNLSYNGSGYPRLVIMLNSVKTVPLDFTATSNGHYDMAVENILSEQYWDGSHTVKLIFFVVDDLHKNTLVTKSSQILNSMDSPERIVSPINGTFSLSMEVTADEVSHMPDWDTIDPGPLYSDQNYIRSKTMTTQNGTSYIDEIEYYDGLGRPVQKIQKGISPKGHDWVTIRQYDGIGRKNREWLPAVIGSKEGEYVNPIVVMEAARITYDKDSHPYSFFEYDSSPLDRIVAQYGPGFNWYEQKRAQRMHYLANKCDVDSLNCIEFISIDAQTDTTLVITSIGNFQDGTLNVVGSSDEDGNMTLEFKNEQNQTLLIRQVASFNGRQNLYDTYYIYDDMGNLRAVLPPEVSARLNETGSWSSDLSQDLRDYAYLYNYDSQNRCVAKKWPGSDWIRIIYDNSNDIPILTQDGEQRRHGEWGFSIPDVLGRIVLCGTCANNPDITSLSNTKVYAYKNFGNPRTILGYGVSGLELDSPKNITSYYYDDYLFLGVPEFLGKDLEYLSSGIDACFLTRYGAEEDSYSSNGLLTGSRTAVYSQTSDSLLARYAAYYYDSKKRPVQTREHYGIVARGEYRAYDFIGNVQRIIDEYSVDSQYTWTQETNFRYDHAGRLLEETTSLARDGATPTTAVRNYTYDELGRIISIGSGPEASAQSEQFSYNLRGWQIKRSSEAFRMSLYYNNPQHSTTVPSYSGNITEWSWTHNAENENTYAFSYDPLARLMSAKQYVGDIQEDRYVEREVTYDKNGNPLSLERLQSGEILHDFTYAYTGNQLATLSDGNVLYHYAYDSNGNMIHDGMNAFDLSYNQLNRVERVLCNNETLANYSYLADGTKFSATDADGNGFYYLGSLVYRKQDDTMTLESSAFNGGRFVATTNGLEPRYFITDHLGSVRVVVNDQGEVLEQNDYYPFGLRWENAESPITDNRYRYNGKEEQSFVSVPYIDYGARMYDPKYGIRWTGVDPLSEKYLYLSPYTFCAGNPIKFVDPNGKKIVDAQGNLLYHNGKWTKAAQGTTAMVIGNAIMKTNIGRILWNRLSDAEYGITIELNPGKGEKKKELGRTDTSRRDDNGKITSIEINIYEGSIAEQMEPQYTGKRAQRLRSLSEEDRIGMVGVHEATHAVYDTPDSSTSEREARAEASEIRHVRELDLKKSIIPEDRNIFDFTIKFKSL